VLRAPRVRALARSECLAALRSTCLGRVALSVGALPAIVPVAFSLAGDRLVFGALGGRPLPLVGRRPVIVAFQADAYDEAQRCGWSVVVVGPAGPGREPSGSPAERECRGGPLVRACVLDRAIDLDPALVSGHRYEASGGCP